MYAAKHQPAAVQPLVDAKSDVNATDNNVSVWMSCSLCVGDRVMMGQHHTSHHHRTRIDSILLRLTCCCALQSGSASSAAAMVVLEDAGYDSVEEVQEELKEARAEYEQSGGAKKARAKDNLEELQLVLSRYQAALGSSSRSGAADKVMFVCLFVYVCVVWKYGCVVPYHAVVSVH